MVVTVSKKTTLFKDLLPARLFMFPGMPKRVCYKIDNDSYVAIEDHFVTKEAISSEKNRVIPVEIDSIEVKESI